MQSPQPSEIKVQNVIQGYFYMPSMRPQLSKGKRSDPLGHPSAKPVEALNTDPESPLWRSCTSSRSEISFPQCHILSKYRLLHSERNCFLEQAVGNLATIPWTNATFNHLLLDRSIFQLFVIFSPSCRKTSTPQVCVRSNTSNTEKREKETYAD